MNTDKVCSVRGWGVWAGAAGVGRTIISSSCFACFRPARVVFGLESAASVRGEKGGAG